jgi:hypothetical protein
MEDFSKVSLLATDPSSTDKIDFLPRDPNVDPGLYLCSVRCRVEDAIWVPALRAAGVLSCCASWPIGGLWRAGDWLVNLLGSTVVVSSFCFVISGAREDSLALESRFEDVCRPLLPPELDTIVILSWH